jgi:hypothetical protein
MSSPNENRSPRPGTWLHRFLQAGNPELLAERERDEEQIRREAEARRARVERQAEEQASLAEELPSRGVKVIDFINESPEKEKQEALRKKQQEFLEQIRKDKLERVKQEKAAARAAGRTRQREDEGNGLG